MLRKLSFIFLSLMLAISSAWAIQNPVDMLNRTIVTAQDNLMEKSEMYQQDPYQLLALVDKKIIPVVDPNVVAQVIVGSKKWSAATPKEQKAFIKSATEMLTFMYAKNVASAGKYKLTLFPFNNENTSWQKKNIVVVNGKITNTDTNQSSDYAVKMFKKNCRWHIYDFDVAGVSILRTYQEQFSSFKTVAEMIKASEKITLKIKKKNYPKMLDKNYELKNV